ncbi:MAG: recombinase family protein, partial [Alphaproteobacteria bacterium]|nr:recombinase family protein [Alphaproteobacteria bacterium]
MMRCAIYARVSTARQAEQNISIPDQIQSCIGYAERRELEVVVEFVELGVSARDDRRPQFQAMIESARRMPKPFDVILIHSFSRFFRDEIQFELYRRQLERHGVAVISITQEMSDGPGGELTRRIIALMDEMRSKEDAKHVKRGMKENARQGFWNGAKPPYGYKAVAAEKRGDKIKKKLALDPLAAETVKLISDMFLKGDGECGPLGVKNIASWLNARGYKTPTGKVFYTSRVHAILTNETYTGNAWFNRKNASTGETRPRDQWVGFSVPIIISTETFHRVQMMLSDRRPTKTPPRLSTSNVLLSGLVLCEACGKPLMMTTGKGGAYRYYKCSGKHLKGECAGGLATTIREEKLDDLILDALTRRLLTPKRAQSIVAAVAKKRADGKSDRCKSSTQPIAGSVGPSEQTHPQSSGCISRWHCWRYGVVSREDGGAENERAELIKLIDVQEAQVKEALTPITLDQAKIASGRLKRLLQGAPTELKKRYVRAFISEIVVGKSE